MKNFVLILGLLCLPLTAQSDVWMWVDAAGKTHFVDTNKPIYTWTDESGEIYYADTPGHEDAVSVNLIWFSDGDLDDLDGEEENEAAGGFAYPGESPEDRFERERAEAYYCKRATEIYESYLNAPQLYRTNEAGEREYLSKRDKALKIAETKARVDELCQ